MLNADLKGRLDFRSENKQTRLQIWSEIQLLVLDSVLKTHFSAEVGHAALQLST